MWPDRGLRLPPGASFTLTAAAFGVAVEVVGPGAGTVVASAADLGVGLIYLACGGVLRARRAEHRLALLLSAVGVSWFLGSLWSAALFVHRGPLVHAVLLEPAGRVRRRAARVVVAAGYLIAATPLAGSDPVTIVFCGGLATAALGSYVPERGPRRRARAAGTTAAMAVAVVLTAGAVARLAGAGASGVALAVYEAVLVLVAVGLTFDRSRRVWMHDAVTGLVVDLGTLTESVTLRDQLARAFGDSSLRLGLWNVEERAYVDDAGRRLSLPRPGSRQVLTPIDDDGERVAALVHDPAGLDDTALLAAAADAIRVAVRNIQLQVEVQTQVRQLESSRRRIVEAAAGQRVLLARELEDGAVRRLRSVAGLLRGLAAGADPDLDALAGEVQQQLQAAQRDLEELARGILPSALIDGGLASALPALAQRTSLLVTVVVEGPRLPPAIEAAVYFVCSEALANIEKHAGATSARMTACYADGSVRVVVADNGGGGADLARGSGLRGLADRVEALGGRLAVSAPEDGGTEVSAVLPVGALS